MTILTTEIALNPDPVVLFAPDRRLSRSGRRVSDRRKIFCSPSGRVGIGYFGLAEFQGVQHRWMDEWLRDFIARNTAPATVGDLASALAQDLNRDVPRADRDKEISGFHLGGLRSGDDAPEFWSVSNLWADGGTINSAGYSANDDFQGRDAANLPAGAVQIYRNGDLRVHAQTWEQRDQIFGPQVRLPGFAMGEGPQGHMRWVQFKMDTLVRFYEQFATVSIVGKPVDVFAITRAGVISPPGTDCR